MSNTSLNSHVQIKKCISAEAEEWFIFWGIEATRDQKYDLSKSIYESLFDGGAIDPVIPETLETEDEHYN
jgi:hypothetical protein